MLLLEGEGMVILLVFVFGGINLDCLFKIFSGVDFFGFLMFSLGIGMVGGMVLVILVEV